MIQGEGKPPLGHCRGVSRVKTEGLTRFCCKLKFSLNEAKIKFCFIDTFRSCYDPSQAKLSSAV